MLSLRTRLYVAGGIMILILVVPAVWVLARLFEVRSIAFDLKTRHADAFLAVGQLQTSLAELNRLQRGYVVFRDPDTREQLYQTLGSARYHLQHLARSGYGPEAAARRPLLDSLWAATRQIDSLVQAGQIGRASARARRTAPLFAEAQTSLSEVAGVIDRRSTREAARVEAIVAQAANRTSIAFGIALALAVLIGGLAVTALVAPLTRLRRAMAEVGAGRFEAPEDLPYDRRDEVGGLCASFRAMTLQLAELERLKAEFVSVASHELKAPVTVMAGYAEMLADGLYGPVTEEQRETLRYVREQARLLSERIGQLLSLSRLEAHGLDLAMETVRLEDVLEGIRQAFEPVARLSGIQLSVEAHESAPAVVELDPERVRHELLGNLVGNALKFTPEGGRVHVWTWGRDSHVVFEVRDNGTGIPEAQLPYIFEKYYQAGHRAGSVGIGLGLAIARQVTEAHGGTIEVRSRPGEGTVFRVRLPVRAAGAVRSSPLAERSAAGPEDALEPSAPVGGGSEFG